MDTFLQNLAEPWPQWLVAMAIALVAVAVILGPALVIAGLLTWLERRVAGRVQSRVGPNRVGPQGLLQWLADGLKLLMKEDLIPGCADRPLFRLAPYLVMTGVFGAFAAVPWGLTLIPSDLNVGILYLLGVTSLVTVGILMSGWASNNKWSLLGGIRSAAQIVSYEVPSSLSVLSVVLLTGTLSMQGIISAQGGWPWEWLIFHNPFSLVAFVIYFIAALAEGNRTPFDLPEAESELVSGYNTEYSGMRFAAFFLAEFANIYLMSAIATTLFLGGWQIPQVAVAEQLNSWPLRFVGVGFFCAKAAFLCFVVIWLRWTLPRLRVDQLMGLCYRYLIPIAFVCLLGNAVLVACVPRDSWIELGLHLATFGAGAFCCGLFVWRVGYHIRRVGDRFDWRIWTPSPKGRFEPEFQVRRYGAFRRGAAREVKR